MIPIDVRVICATNKDLKTEMKKGSFRQDLYYRLNVINLRIPPLRERSTDVILLFNHFLKTASRQINKNIKSVAPEILNYLIAYSWPGNVRELQNVVERMLNTATGDYLSTDHLPEEIRNPLSSPVVTIKSEQPSRATGISIREYRDLNKQKDATAEKNRLIELLKKNNGNIMRTAKELGLSRPTLYKKMQNYHLSD
jgi:DNA-binding NtrC family response regulator